MKDEFVSPKNRKSILDQQRRLKMAKSAHAYVRGNTSRFYEWIQNGSVIKSIPAGPSIWICGDCHIGNLGPIADSEGQIDIQIRDLDQTGHWQSCSRSIAPWLILGHGGKELGFARHHHSIND